MGIKINSLNFISFNQSFVESFMFHGRIAKMTGGEEIKANKSKILVGFRMQEKSSRELLNWALVKVAEPGDSVAAIHVCKNSEDASTNQILLDEYLEVYEGLCSALKIEVKGQVLRGSSVNRILNREAKRCSAAAVVLGASKRNRVFWAKRFAKQLPRTTDVMVIHLGKIIFSRSNNHQLTVLNMDAKPSYQRSEENSDKETQSKSGDSETCSEISCWSVTPKNKDGFWLENFDRKCEVLNHVDRTKTGRSVSFSSGNIPEEKPGWPLLRRATSASAKVHHSRSVSVVGWVMSLPDRFPHSTDPILSDNPLTGTIPESVKRFGLDVLKTATSNFSSENLIGNGGCNRVYKGILPDGKPVAVKILKSSQEAINDFVQEIGIISSLNHNHITPLLGICTESKHLISVYHFSSKGSLEENLRSKQKGKSVLPWEERFNIAVGIAEALDHLHNRRSEPVIHRDVKSSNILLSDKCEPQLSDFGLAIWGPASSDFTIQREVVGTFGYLAPEYFMYGRVSEKIDVYAFGVVLLELVSGRKPISDQSPKGQESLVIWAKPMVESGDAEGILDPNLGGEFNEAELHKMVVAASLCLTRAARVRPNIREILRLLRGDSDLEKWIKCREEEDLQNQDTNDDEVYPNSSTELHLSLALLDVDDDSLSSSDEPSKERWSHSSISD